VLLDRRRVGGFCRTIPASKFRDSRALVTPSEPLGIVAAPKEGRKQCLPQVYSTVPSLHNFRRSPLISA